MCGYSTQTHMTPSCTWIKVIGAETPWGARSDLYCKWLMSKPPPLSPFSCLSHHWWIRCRSNPALNRVSLLLALQHVTFHNACSWRDFACPHLQLLRVRVCLSVSRETGGVAKIITEPSASDSCRRCAEDMQRWVTGGEVEFPRPSIAIKTFGGGLRNSAGEKLAAHADWTYSRTHAWIRLHQGRGT